MTSFRHGREAWGAEEYHVSGAWADRTLYDYLAEHARSQPEAVAIISERLADGERDELTFGEYERLVRRIAGGLLELGISTGDVVAVQLPNWWQACAAAVAAARIGAVVNPLTPILRRRDLRVILATTNASVLIVPDTFRGFSHREMATHLRADLPGLQHVFVVHGRDGVDGCRSFEAFFLDHDWEHRHADRLAAITVDPDAAFEIMFSSGTTGRPKGVVHSHNTVVASARGLLDLWPVTREPDHPIYMVSTLGHQTGFAVGLCGSLVAGQKLVLHDVFRPRELLRSAQDERWSWTVAATPFLLDIIEVAAECDYDLSSIDFLMTGGAPVPSHLAQRVAEVLHCVPATGYGMTETGPSLHTLIDDPIVRVARCVGRPVTGLEARVVDDSGQPVPVGAPGQLQMRGPNIAIDYVPDHALYEQVMHDGWLDTGDLAVIDSDGYVAITGRAKDIIVRGGENIPVVDVENLIYTHPAVAAVAVVAMPDPRLGERACAFVVPKPGLSLTLGDLVDFAAAEGLTTHFVPERLELRDALPMTPAGKVQKYCLREEVAALLGQASAPPSTGITAPLM